LFLPAIVMLTLISNVEEVSHYFGLQFYGNFGIKDIKFIICRSNNRDEHYQLSLRKWFALPKLL